MNKNTIIPKKLINIGEIRVIAPVRSMGLLSENSKYFAKEALEKKGFRLSFGKRVDETDEFMSSSVESRILDLHEAFSDDNIDAILSVIGGYNSNQLLDYIDYSLIEKNPKIICGFSDMTALANAITVKTGMITYIGPHFSSWGMKQGFEYSAEYFMKSCLKSEPFEIFSSSKWSDDPWYIDQENRIFKENEGPWIINEGHAIGKIYGGHVRCFNALQGTEYFPDLKDTVLFLEEDAEINPQLFDRQLQSIIQQKDFSGVNAILIGRFQNETKMTLDIIKKIIKTKKELDSIPVIANLDFGHTTPMFTIPIGGVAQVNSENGECSIKIIEH